MKQPGVNKLGPQRGQEYQANELVTIKGQVCVCQTEAEAAKFCPKEAEIVILLEAPQNDFIIIREKK